MVAWFLLLGGHDAKRAAGTTRQVCGGGSWDLPSSVAGIGDPGRSASAHAVRGIGRRQPPLRGPRAIAHRVHGEARVGAGRVRRVLLLARAPEGLQEARGPRTASHSEGGKRTGRDLDDITSHCQEAGGQRASGQAKTPIVISIPRFPDFPILRFFDSSIADYRFPIIDVRSSPS
jgi:hypothetical protein